MVIVMGFQMCVQAQTQKRVCKGMQIVQRAKYETGEAGRSLIAKGCQVYSMSFGLYPDKG
jgi:hypothetical protein